MYIESLCAKRLYKTSDESLTNGNAIALRGGYIHQVGGGLFALSYLGNKVCNNIEQIIREEMESLEIQEIKLPVVSPASLWKQTNRYDNIDVLAKFTGQNGTDYVICPTHEEVVTDFVKAQISSYKQFPVKVFQIQTKFRDELRARAGLIRVREFVMKDAYTFHSSAQDLEETYQKIHQAYHKIFARIGFKNVIDIESSVGDMGGSKAHEFSLIHPIGEDKLAICDACGYKANAEITDEHLCPRCRGSLRFERGIELGNIFQLGDKYTKALDFSFTNQADQKQYPLMGCYGIGIGRAFASILEQNATDKGITWNLEIAPFKVHLIGINSKEEIVSDSANKLYHELKSNGIETIIDIRKDVGAGTQFSDADLIGAPLRIILSKNNIENKEVEIIDNINNEVIKVALENIVSTIL